MSSFSSLANPKQAIIISCKDDDKINMMTACWHMPVSMNPPLYAVSVGKARHSCKMIQDSKVFVVNFMPYKKLDEVLKVGSMSGAHVDKFKETGLLKEACDSIDCVRLKEACAYLECEVIQEVEVGDHIIFVGKVTKSKLVRDEKRPLQVGDDKFSTSIN